MLCSMNNHHSHGLMFPFPHNSAGSSSWTEEQGRQFKSCWPSLKLLQQINQT